MAKSDSSPFGDLLPVHFTSLGCAKNLVDSERMLGALAQSACVVCQDPADAQVLVINTCGFLEASIKEAEDHIRAAVALKQHDPGRRVVVTGCMPERVGSGVAERFPEVDAWLGVEDQGRIVSIVRTLAQERGIAWQVAPRTELQADLGRFRMTPRHYAFVKVSEGCDHACSFCTIPAIRGNYRSKTPEQISSEIAELEANGAREFMLISQDTAFYGRDFKRTAPERKGYELADLVAFLHGQHPESWFRIHYAHPHHVTDRLIEQWTSLPRLHRYIDMPVQHGSSKMLKAMRREQTREEIQERIDLLRKGVPGISIRSTVIAGYPGETEDDFAQMIDFLRAAKFERLSAFKYSDEPGTKAYETQPKVPKDQIDFRYDVVMRTQQLVHFAAVDREVGQTLRVVIDEPADKKGWWFARGSADAPEVDAVVRVKGDRKPGEAVEVKIARRVDYDREGTFVRLLSAPAGRRKPAAASR